MLAIAIGCVVATAPAVADNGCINAGNDSALTCSRQPLDEANACANGARQACFLGETKSGILSKDGYCVGGTTGMPALHDCLDTIKPAGPHANANTECAPN